MGIVRLIRERLGLAADLADSAVLRRELDGSVQELKNVAAEIPIREQRLGLDSIQAPDGGDAAGRELQELKFKRDRLTAKCDSLRREIDDALEREDLTERETACAVLDARRRALEEAARAVALAIAAVVPLAKVLIAAHADFTASASDDRGLRSWHLDRNVSEFFCDLAANEIYFRAEGAVQPTKQIEQMQRYRRRGDLEEYIEKFRGYLEAVRSGIQRERGESRPGSADAAA